MSSAEQHVERQTTPLLDAEGPDKPQTPLRSGAGAEGSKAKPTPKSMKAPSMSHYSSHKYKREEDPSSKMWQQEFRDHHVNFEGDIQEFLSDYVPSAAEGTHPKEFEPLEKTFFERLKVKKISEKRNTGEKKNTQPMSDLLNEMMERFPKDRQMLFYNHSDKDIPALSLTHHETRPDIVASFPGYDLQSPDCWNFTWPKVATVLELKSGGDPFDKNGNVKAGKEPGETVMQLAKNGRNLLQAHMSCFAFVVGVYGDDMRIFRFDRAGVVSSPSINYKTNPEIVEQFYWRLVHPKSQSPGNIVGADATITKPEAEELRRMIEEVTKVYKDLPAERLKFIEETARWMKIKLDISLKFFDEDFGEGDDASSETEVSNTRCFVFDIPLYESPGLFSRATVVQKAIFDPKVYGERYTGKVFALKDAWREETRGSESDFYKKFEKWISEHSDELAKSKLGFARCFGSLNLGADKGAEEDGYITKSASLLERRNNRCRERTLTYPVGRPLHEFTSTKELIQAIRDAIHGHEIVALECNVLHRDISAGNILLPDYEEGSGEGGFIHDFDYGRLLESLEESETASIKSAAVREMTGTYPFMSIGVLGDEPHWVHHDLESFYWVLIYIVLRHTDHQHKHGVLACRKLFDHIDNDILRSVKSTWLLETQLIIKDNKPLTHLLSQLRRLFRAQQNTIDAAGTPLTHTLMLEVFDEALLKPEWPENDVARNFKSWNEWLSKVIRLPSNSNLPEKRKRGDSAVAIRSVSKKASGSSNALRVEEE